MRHASPFAALTTVWSAPLAIGSAVVWGVVEFAALCRSRWTLRRAPARDTRAV